jgi:L-threonylcarbamoyladenylate synthase
LHRVFIDPDAPIDRDSNELVAAVAALRSGGVVAFPTETFYGLAVDPRSSSAVKGLFALKERRDSLALPLIAADIEQVREHVGKMTPLAERLALRGWPGPLTLIIPGSPRLCADLQSSTRTVAVRVAGNAIARALAAAAGHAITSTSANLSGAPPSSTPEQVVDAFGDGIDVLIDAGDTPGGLASTIVDATGDAPVLVRAGAIAWERVLEFLD